MNKLILKTVVALICLFYSSLSNSQSFYSFEQVVNGNQLRQNNAYDFERAKSLITEFHPKLYLTTDFENDYSPLETYFAETDVPSFPLLINHQKASTLEIITIKVKSTDNLTVNLQSIQRDFRSLKFIHVICEFTCDLNYIRRCFLNDDPNILIVYSISSPM